MTDRQKRARHNSPENGQAMVLLLLALTGLLGFAAVALDGGNMYTEQRRAQAAADNAALAAAFERMNGATDTNVLANRALATAALNGYDNSSDNSVSINRPPTQGPYAGNTSYIEVIITQTVQTALAHFVYQGPVQVTVHAVARGAPQQAPVAGYAIITLANCRSIGGKNAGYTGGGSDKKGASIDAYNGGIWLNSTEVSGGDACALSPGPQGLGINAHDGYPITSVGSYDYSNWPYAYNLSPVPIETGGNGGVPIPDPLAALPEPTCESNGSGNGTAASPYQPGNYVNSGSGSPKLNLSNGTNYLAPGIFCITGNLKGTGNVRLEGHGVVLYMKTGDLEMTGNAELYLTGPTADYCLGEAGSASASCSYAGIAVFVARDNCGENLEVGGNGFKQIVGTVYGVCSTFNAHGGGNSAEEALVRGQVIVSKVWNNGNGSLAVWYEDSVIFQLNPFVQMVQ